MKAPLRKQIQDYLRRVWNAKSVRVRYFGNLSDYMASAAPGDDEVPQIKVFGYGTPLLVVYDADGIRRQSIIATIGVSRGFGHDYRSDRADSMILCFDTWNRLPKHGRVTDLGAFDKRDSSMISLGDTGEFFILRPLVRGVEYYRDLDRLFETGSLEPHDLLRAKGLADYLASIHSRKHSSNDECRSLYARKIRDTIGHGECIFGLSDSYPESNAEFLRQNELERIEIKCVKHRWKLKGRAGRLSQVHGDFHPWNILFSGRKRSDFSVLDRSRGEWGEPADDVCALSVNYIFYSLRKYGKLDREFAELYDAFISTYMRSTSDGEIFEAMPLFYTFRALVIGSPMWYPTLTPSTRRKIFNFANNILDSGMFDPSKVNDYFR